MSRHTVAAHLSFHGASIDRGTRRLIDCNKAPASPPRQSADICGCSATTTTETTIHHWLKPLFQMSATMTHKGECFCGAVQIEVSGEPEGMGYCHCRSCRSWSGGPVNAFTLWKPAAVRVAAGAEHIGTFKKTPISERQYCKKCGGHLLTNHPTLGLVDVFAATLPTLAFKPGVHVNYSETVLPMRDGLPKLKDFPAELGGSGESVPE
jgi:hypothetical protein